MLLAIKRWMTPANIVMVIALVFAMAGGAYAAKKYIITSSRQISPSVLKQLNGKAGPAGPEGKAGAPGANGKDGTNGTNGANGVNGESVTATSVETSDAACAKLGGSKFTVGGKESYACNGKEGEPWTTGGVLPKGRSLKGEWNLYAFEGVEGRGAFDSVSFALPLKASPTVHYIRVGEPDPTGCSGNVENPGASEGNLCVFASVESHTEKELEPGKPLPTICQLEAGVSGCFPAQASKYGFGLETIAAGEKTMVVYGSWAVTAS